MFLLIFLVLILFVRPAYFLGHETIELFVNSIGIVCALTGGLVRILTIGLVYIRRGRKDRKVFASNLVTEGIYAHVSNPITIALLTERLSLIKL